MAGHIIIELKNLKFFATHGMYQEELKVGNEFVMDIYIESRAPKEIITSIDQTVNYVEVYQIAEEEFSHRHQLLETCVMKIADKLEKHFPDIEKLTINVRKMNPPITNFSGSVGISYSKSFK
jgi:dihydroneopterin aldolase